MKISLPIILLLSSSPLIGQILPTSRTNDWGNYTGVPGGIPYRTTIFTNIPAGASLSTVQSMVNICPSNQVVQLAAGNYTWTGDLNIPVSGITVRGSTNSYGTNGTSITISGKFYIGNVAWYNDWATPNASRHKSWTNRLSKGTTSIQVTNTGDLAVGMLIYMDQINNTNINAIDGSCGAPGGLYPNTNRFLFQMNRVTGISGTTIILDSPIYSDQYASSQSPEIWWYGAQPGAVLSGIEDMIVIGGGVGAELIYFQNAYGCWAKNIDGSNARYGFNFWSAFRCEVLHCSMRGYVGFSDNYVFQTMASSGLRLEDNWSSEGWWNFQGCSGSAISHNYLRFTTGSSGWMQGGFGTHGAHSHDLLFEGNYAPGLWLDFCYGSASHIVALHNRFVGDDIENPSYNRTGDKEAFKAENYQRFVSSIGNILGTIGTNTWYDDGSSSYTCHDSGRVYVVGVRGCSTTYDITTRDTLIKAVNWNSASNSVALDGYTYSDVPNSYIRSSKPSWFGNLNWPAYDPQTVIAASIDRTNIPAGYRYVYGIDPSSSEPSPSPSTNSLRIGIRL